MHRIVYTYREVLPSDLPRVRDADGELRAAMDDELLSLGLKRISGDYFSAIEQHERDDETLMWSPKGQALAGTVVSQGLLPERHAKLPADVKPRILRAAVIRSSTSVSTKEAAESNLAEVGAVLGEVVGDVGGAPLIDTISPEALLEEAKRLADTPDSGFDRVTVPMADVTGGDVVEADSLIPHSWAGEPKR